MERSFTRGPKTLALVLVSLSAWSCGGPARPHQPAGGGEGGSDEMGGSGGGGGGGSAGKSGGKAGTSGGGSGGGKAGSSGGPPDSGTSSPPDEDGGTTASDAKPAAGDGGPVVSSPGQGPVAEGRSPSPRTSSRTWTACPGRPAACPRTASRSSTTPSSQRGKVVRIMYKDGRQLPHLGRHRAAQLVLERQGLHGQARHHGQRGLGLHVGEPQHGRAFRPADPRRRARLDVGRRWQLATMTARSTAAAAAASSHEDRAHEVVRLHGRHRLQAAAARINFYVNGKMIGQGPATAAPDGALRLRHRTGTTAPSRPAPSTSATSASARSSRGGVAPRRGVRGVTVCGAPLISLQNRPASVL